ncbi:MAG: flippase-like domain-containing protein [Polyangiaceae bacterium]|jgi:uncharacterized protein (TIRG00374 family)|nr:flippase-like domain-containing protein [Polyangiaceae bacterium]
MLAVVLLRLPRPGEVFSQLARADLALVGLTLAINLLAIQLKVVRWQLLLRARGISYGSKDAWFAFGASAYLGMLTPGRVGDVLRIQYLRHDKGTPYSEGLASVVMDRLSDLYVLAAFFAVAITHFGSQLLPELRLLGWAAVAATTLGPLALLVPGVAERLFGAMYRKLSRDPEAKGLDVFLQSLRAQARRATPVTLPLTIAAFLVSFGQGWLVARALGLELSYFDVGCLTAIASLLSLLPISVSGVGVREVFFAAVFPSLGYSAEQGVGYGMMVFALLYLGVAAVGFVAWQIRPPPAHVVREVTGPPGQT